MILKDEFYMKEAFKQAQLAFDADEVPVGAVVACKGQIIAKAYNQTELLNDVTAHAEMIAITSAANYLNSKYLPDCTLYVTLEPCFMCAGASNWAQMGKIVYGASDAKAGYSIIKHKVLHPKTEIVGGIMQVECEAILKEFFQRKRDLRI